MKEETQAWIDRAVQDLEAARILQREGFFEIVVSRAYYAMFYAAEALLRERNLVFSSHAATIAAFGKEFAKTGVLDPKFHRYLIGAQIARNEGDYNIGRRISSERAAELLAWATEFVAAVQQVLERGP